MLPDFRHSMQKQTLEKLRRLNLYCFWYSVNMCCRKTARISGNLMHSAGPHWSAGSLPGLYGMCELYEAWMVNYLRF